MSDPSNKTEASNQRLEDAMRKEAEAILREVMHRRFPSVEVMEALTDRLVQVWNHNTPKRIAGGVHINRVKP